MTLEEALEKLKSENCQSGLKLNLFNIGDKGAQALAGALASGKCPSGLLLSLAFNVISNIGSRALAGALRSGKCPSGFRLCLIYNNIGDEGAQEFANALSSGHCPSGLGLDLDCNKVGYKGAQALAEALNSGKCRFGTMIGLYFKECNFKELSRANNRRIQTSSSLQLATLIGGFSRSYCQVKISPIARLPAEIMDHIAKFLPGNITVSIVLNKLNHFFNTALKSTSEFSDDFLQKHRFVNPVVQNEYDKKFGLSLWEYPEESREQFHKSNKKAIRAIEGERLVQFYK